MKLTLLFLLVLMVSCSKKSEQSLCEARDLYNQYEEWKLETFPLYASRKNQAKRHNTFFYETEENYARVNKAQKEFLNKASKLQSQKECQNEELNLALFKYDLEDEINDYPFEMHFIQFTSLGGPHTRMAQMYKYIPLETVQNYRDYIERLSKIPQYFKEVKNLSLKGVAKNITPPQPTFQDYEKSFLSIAEESPEKSSFYQPFLNFPEKFAEQERVELSQKALQVINENVLPAYKDLYQFWVKDYYPKLRTSLAAIDLPQGRSFINLK